MNHIIKNNILIFLITLTSFFLAISYSFEQTAIEGGLIISGIVKYPEEFSVLKTFYFNSWTFLHQFAAILLKLDFSTITISRIIIFFSTFFYFLGIYLLVKSITKSLILSFFIGLSVMIFRKNFGDVDYPTMIFSTHSAGVMSIALSTFIFGLIANRNFFLAGFFSILLFIIHPVIGLWFISIFLFTGMYSKYLLKFVQIEKKFFYGMLISLFPAIISFSFYYINIIEKIPFDKEVYDTYLNHWGSHQINYGNPFELHIEYLLKSLLLFFVSLFGLKYFFNQLSNSCKLMLMSVLTSIVFSVLIYFLYKFFRDFFPYILISIIPPRFMLVHSVIGWPIVLSFFYLFLKNFLINKNININYAYISVLFLLFAYSISHYKNIVIRTSQFLSNINYDESLSTKNVFWKKLQGTKTKGYVLSNPGAQNLLFRKSLKPVIYLAESTLSGVPYHPYTVEHLKKIFENVYKVPFNKTLKKREISDEIIKDNFENRNTDEWIEISKEFNINSLVVPKDWKINLKLEFVGNEYAFYRIN